MSKSIFAAVVLILGSVCWAQVNIPPGFEVVHITDNPDDYANRPQINNCGEVVFGVRIDQSELGEEIFLYDNGRLIRVTDDDVRQSHCDINDDGTIVWTLADDGRGHAGTIVMYRDGTVTEIGPGEGPHINNLGHVAWYMLSPIPCAYRSDIFLYDGETIQQITDDGFSNQVVQINDQDELVWTRYDQCADPDESHIMRYSDGVITQLTDGHRWGGGPRMNDVGQITWRTEDSDDTDHYYIELWDDGVTVTVIDPGSGPPGINNAGEILFIRDGIDDWDQIWLFRAGELFQITDEPYTNGEQAINEAGEIVWQAKLYPESDIYLLRRLRTGEADFDGDVDLDDLAVFGDCMTGPGDHDHLCACRFFDLDHDHDVDMADYVMFQRAFTGEK